MRSCEWYMVQWYLKDFTLLHIICACARSWTRSGGNPQLRCCVHLAMLRICRQVSVTGPIYLPALLIGMQCTVGGKWLINVITQSCIQLLFNSSCSTYLRILSKTKTSRRSKLYSNYLQFCCFYSCTHFKPWHKWLTHCKMRLAPLYIAFQSIMLEGMWIYIQTHHTDLPADTQHNITRCTQLCTWGLPPLHVHDRARYVVMWKNLSGTTAPYMSTTNSQIRVLREGAA